MNKKFKIAFLISLLLNLVLIGVLMGEGWHKASRMRASIEEEQALLALPENRQQEFSSLREELRKDGEATREAIREVRRDTVRILTADVFDENAYQANLEKIRELRAQQMQRMSESVKKLASTWSATERAALAKLMRRPPHWRTPESCNTSEPASAPQP